MNEIFLKKDIEELYRNFKPIKIWFTNGIIYTWIRKGNELVCVDVSDYDFKNIKRKKYSIEEFIELLKELDLYKITSSSKKLKSSDLEDIVDYIYFFKDNNLINKFKI